ncbi:MAG TPA: extracellular solute-binding protein [Candidatus Limnocylindria bacterium]|nr:extracellular solute-binding protein [Candidatus Limnocylindria bacterium]
MKTLRVGALAMTLGLVAAACGTSGPQGMLQELGDGEGELNLIIWAGYAERGDVDPAYDWVTPFEEETGCIVKTTEMTDSAQGVQLLQSGEYDGGSFSGNASVRLMAAGDVAPVNVELLENYDAVFEGLKNKSHNSLDGVPYGVPHGRGPNLLTYNTDVVTETPTSWDIIWENGGDYKGKISVYAFQDFIADAALHLMQKQPELGITNPYQLTQAQFDAAIDLLEQLDANDPVYWQTYSDQVSSYTSGEVVVGTSWQFQVNLLQGEDLPIEAVLPEEGSTGWSDTWMIAKNADHPNCMYMWMDHMMSAEANGQATVWFGEAPTSQAACDYAESIAPGHCEQTHATDEAYYSKIWYWSTPVEDCGDDDANTTCVTQEDWTQAWATITGG